MRLRRRKPTLWARVVLAISGIYFLISLGLLLTRSGQHASARMPPSAPAVSSAQARHGLSAMGLRRQKRASSNSTPLKRSWRNAGPVAQVCPGVRLFSRGG
jgi:hypothetical protein